jgi:uncharacterized membrane protein YjjP (DUF1212 family)
VTRESAPPDTTDEPLHDVARAVVAVGTALLGEGTSSYRVERAVQRAGASLGCDRVTALVTLRSVVITVQRGGQTWTESARAPRLHVNADHLDGLETVIRHLPKRVSADELSREVESVLARPGYYPSWVTALAVGAACGSFAALSGGHATEISAAFAAATTGQAVRTWLLRHRVNPFAVIAVVAALAAGLYLAIVSLVTSLDLVGSANESGFVSSVLFLVPGFPLVSGTLDILRMHVEAGLARLTYGVTVLVMASLGLLAVAGVANPPLPDPAGVDLDPLLLMTLLAWTALAGAGFAVLFNLPPRLLLAPAVAAAAGNAVRLLLLDNGQTVTTAALAGATVVGLVAAAVAARTHSTRIVLAIPGVIPMVPGASAYTGLVALSQGDLPTAIEFGAEATLIIGSLAIGLALARLLTDRDWAFQTAGS